MPSKDKEDSSASVDEAYPEYEASCRQLQAFGVLPQGPLPQMPDRMPRYGDEGPLGVSFFRTGLAGIDMAGLTLPRTFFGRSEIADVSFRGADLSESNLCWNDFLKVDFGDCILYGSDLRSSRYVDVSFKDADLTGCDLRHSVFERCVFSGAAMSGVKLTKSGAASLGLVPEQLADIDWQKIEGSEPDGG